MCSNLTFVYRETRNPGLFSIVACLCVFPPHTHACFQLLTANPALSLSIVPQFLGIESPVSGCLLVRVEICNLWLYFFIRILYQFCKYCIQLYIQISVINPWNCIHSLLKNFHSRFIPLDRVIIDRSIPLLSLLVLEPIIH